MRTIALPARRALITALVIIILLYFSYAYAAIVVAVLFLLSWFVFPVKQPRDFCLAVIPTLDSLAGYLRAITQVLSDADEVAYNELKQAESDMFKSLVSSYPEWVYRSGFNPGLRSGFRYFLIQLEHAADLCCSMTYWLRQFDTLTDKSELLQLLRQATKINIDLLNGLSRTMHHHAEKTLRPVNDVNVDLVSDITALEGALQRLVPPSLELLDMSSEYVYTTALVRDVKDLREVLLALVAAVPGES